jgi:hypothetical protein
MLRRPLVIIALFIVAAVLWWGYENTRLPPGVEAKGAQDWIPWISLAGSVVSLITGLVTLGLKVIEIRKQKPQSC